MKKTEHKIKCTNILCMKYLCTRNKLRDAMLVDHRLFAKGAGSKGKSTFFVSTVFFIAVSFSSEVN
jgi:hypothetical protein